MTSQEIYNQYFSDEEYDLHNAPIDVYSYRCGWNEALKRASIVMKTVVRPTGEWEFNQYDGNANIGNWHCSECRHIEFGGYNQKPTANFCPNCGAEMRGEKNEHL